ncbi:MAG: PAS domain S-box protein [Desulfobacteraceae bacterium]|nr:PAS domain S-box protein [Desulfobacteraceae bacterium]MBC2752033.1 PAS domain S-box protein [Desulfobacteraceae bacterium]
MPETDRDLQARLFACEEALKVETSRRLSAEVTLRETRQNFKKALQALPVIIYATDQDGSLIFYNREFERVSGYAADDLQNGPGLLDLLLREDEGLCLVNDVTCRKWKIETKDGREKVVVWSEESSAVPLAGWRSWKIGLDITELETVREEVKILQGLLPICANCKQIRDAKGVWTSLETYIAEQSEADFTHGICPACLAKLYPKTDSDT